VAIAPGTRFGAYEVAEQIGVGGMGEVYRATDTNLKRDVAVKILPESFASDADRLARFQREGEALASLNHSNIAQIYGLEKADGKTVIAMELIDGPTLAERIAEGPIPPDKALGIARQIADALEAAHGLQIVHRDLKPQDIQTLSVSCAAPTKPNEPLPANIGSLHEKVDTLFNASSH
jgi:serine/threonine-protein kinase